MKLDDKAIQRIKRMAYRQSLKLHSADKLAMQMDMEQAGYVAYLESEHNEYVTLDVQRAMTREWLRWTKGIKNIRSKAEQLDREEPTELIKPSQILDKRPSTEAMVLGMEIMVFLRKKFSTTNTPEAYDALLKEMILQGEGGHLPNGTLSSIGQTGGTAKFRRDRIKQWLAEALER